MNLPQQNSAFVFIDEGEGEIRHLNAGIIEKIKLEKKEEIYHILIPKTLNTICGAMCASLCKPITLGLSVKIFSNSLNASLRETILVLAAPPRPRRKILAAPMFVSSIHHFNG
jgi:hypothetical protein